MHIICNRMLNCIPFVCTVNNATLSNIIMYEHTVIIYVDIFDKLYILLLAVNYPSTLPMRFAVGNEDRVSTFINIGIIRCSWRVGDLSCCYFVRLPVHGSTCSAVELFLSRDQGCAENAGYREIT